MARPKWYQRKEFKQPVEDYRMGDGSTVNVLRIDDHTLLAMRDYLGGDSERVRTSVDGKGIYHYQVAERNQHGEAKPFIGDPDWHAPYVYSNAIPGDSPSSINTYDIRTNTHQATRKDLEEYYDSHNLALASRVDLNNMHEKTPPGSMTGAHNRFQGKAPGRPSGASRTITHDDLSKV